MTALKVLPSVLLSTVSAPRVLTSDWGDWSRARFTAAPAVQGRPALPQLAVLSWSLNWALPSRKWAPST